MPLSRTLTKAIGMAVIPNKGPATVVLNAATGSPTTINVFNAWLKQTSGGLRDYGGVNVQQDGTVINIWDKELNPLGTEGREIRPEDEITFGGVTYVVTGNGGNLVSNRTTWKCQVQKKIQ